MKKYLEIALKIILFIASFCFLWKQIKEKDIFNIAIESNHVLIFCLIGSLFILNWSLEILKWKIIISSIKTISFLESSKQTILSLIASPFVPLKLGELSIKIIYFDSSQKEKVVIAHILVNLFQLIVSLFFGIIGLVFLGINDLKLYSSFFIVLAIIFVIILLIFIFKKTNKFGNIIQNKINQVSFFSKKNNQKVLFISFLRYLVFLHQFYLFLVFFKTDISYYQSIIIISSMYALSAIIPSFSVSDLAIKGSISIYLFSFYTNETEKIFWTSSCMWIFNTLFPILIAWIWFLINKFKFK